MGFAGTMTYPDCGGLITQERVRLIYRTHLDCGRRKDRRKGFTEAGCARPLDGAHQQLYGPIFLVWDNLPAHTVCYIYLMFVASFMASVE